MPGVRFDKIDLLVYYYQKLAEHAIRSAHGQECSCKRHVLPVISPEVYTLVVDRLERNGEVALEHVRAELRKEREDPADSNYRKFLEKWLGELGTDPDEL